jgi:hypothetical protein
MRRSALDRLSRSTSTTPMRTVLPGAGVSEQFPAASQEPRRGSPVAGTLIVLAVRPVGGDIGEVFRGRLGARIATALIAVPLLFVKVLAEPAITAPTRHCAPLRLRTFHSTKGD